jgi:hypothetical protein
MWQMRLELAASSRHGTDRWQYKKAEKYLTVVIALCLPGLRANAAGGN